jgi:hypothetical protein
VKPPRAKPVRAPSLSHWQVDCLTALTEGDLVARDGQFCREQHAAEQQPELFGCRTVRVMRRLGWVVAVGELGKHGAPQRVAITAAGRRALRQQQEGARS